MKVKVVHNVNYPLAVIVLFYSWDLGNAESALCEYFCG
jgi:hypothetical protein